MKRWFVGFLLLSIFVYTAIAFLAYGVTFPLISPAKKYLSNRFYDYSGITHVHSKLSTGSGTIAEIALSAKKARCQFVILTDLNAMTKLAEAEGYMNDILMISGGEHTYLGGHLLVYNLANPEILKSIGQNQILFNDWLHQAKKEKKGGFLVAAHPFLPHKNMDALNLPGLQGMEVLNLDSIWNDQWARSKTSILWSFLLLPINADLAYLRLFHEPDREIQAWDEIAQSKKMVGFAGSDSTANAIPFPEKSFKFPSYIRSFRLMKNHVLLKSELTGQFKEDKRKILEALAQGSFYFSLDLIGDPAGFYFLATQNHQEYLPGAQLKRNQPIILTIDLGREIDLPYEINLLRNGKKIAGSNRSFLKFEVKQSGTYRAVVRVIPTLPLPDGKTWFPWIYTNAIRVE